jgi:hypothetical protein
MKDGFYIYEPKPSKMNESSPFSLRQVLQVIEGEVWLTGMSETFSMKTAKAYGKFGLMVLDLNE